MASGLLRDRLKRLGVGADVRTAGLLDADRLVSDGAVRALKGRGIDISDHTSRQLDAGLLREATLVVGMERRHVEEAVLLSREAWPRAFTVKELVRRSEAVGPRTSETLDDWVARIHLGRSAQDFLAGPGDDIADPYGRTDDDYRLTADELDDLLGRFVDLAWAHADNT
jgi:protein-tyrosine-phosphatase